MVYRYRLTYDEFMGVLDLKENPTTRIGNSLNPEIHDLTDINKTLNYILHDNVKVSNKIDDIRLKSKLKINQTLIFTKNSLLYTFRVCSITFLSFRRN